MAPLVANLTVRDPYGRWCLYGLEFAGVEGVTARRSLGMHRSKICVNSLERRGMCSETVQLGVVPVALSLSAQHGPREQRLSPEGD